MLDRLADSTNTPLFENILPFNLAQLYNTGPHLQRYHCIGSGAEKGFICFIDGSPVDWRAAEPLELIILEKWPCIL